MAYEFHYTPTGTGVISGKEVLEQTEDAINDLGNTAISGVQEALDKAEQALTNSANAVDDAQTALNTANNAEGVAVQAQNDVSNLSGTVTNIGNRVTTAEGNITNLQGRMTTAEGNIGNLQGRMTTAEGNIGNLQTAVSTAQATANSAQQTATTARLQSYVLRYSSTTLVASSTNSNSLLDNTDNLKVDDKVIDASGVIYSVTAIDTANSTFTIGTSLIDLAQDSDVVHKSGNETITGTKTIKGADLKFESSIGEYGVTGGGASLNFYDKNSLLLSYIKQGIYTSGISYHKFSISAYDSDNNQIERTITLSSSSNSLATIYLRSDFDNIAYLGTTGNRWSRVYAMNYYYGNDNVEFSTKFVTTDTAQTISGVKTFSDNPLVGNGNTNITISNRQITANGLVSTTGNHAYSFMQLQAKVNYADSSSPIIVTVTLDINEDAYADGRKSSLSPNSNNFTNLGKSGKRWANVYATNYYYGGSEIEFSTKFVTTDTNQTISGNKTFSSINGVEPSSLSLPNINNSIDISSYITDLSGININSYTPLVNGYIVISCNSTDVDYIKISNNLDFISIVDNTNNQFTSGKLGVWQPCLSGVNVQIRIKASALATARFYPCQGNV